MIHPAQQAMQKHRNSTKNAISVFTAMAQMRVEREMGKRDWPSEVFVPTSVASTCCTDPEDAIYQIFGYNHKRDKKFHQIFWKNYLFSAWRMTLGIYRFDETVYPALLNTPLDDDTPTEVFIRLPEWCVYVETPDFPTCADPSNEFDMFTKNGNVIGFWAMLNCGDERKTDFELLVCPHFDNESADFAPIPIVIRKGLTLSQALDIAYAQKMGFDVFRTAHVKKAIKPFLGYALSLILWLCSDDPDISDIKDMPIPKIKMPVVSKSKKGYRFLPPSSPVYYQLAKRIGGEIRSSIDSHMTQGISETKRKAHIRRAHWHGYWRGVGAERVFDVRWQPPIFVSGVN